MDAANIGKRIAIVLFAYVGLVVVFESALGVIQPEADTTLVITTSDGPRVVSALESGGNLYVAANHWPRAWYTTARENPEVSVDWKGETSDRTAVPVTGAEHDRVNAEHSLGLLFRFVTGFPPRYFLRLDPR